MAYGEIFETTNQNGERIRVRDELPDHSTEITELQLRCQKIRACLANLAITMNTYGDWFTPASPPPSVPILEAFNPDKRNQLPLTNNN